MGNPGSRFSRVGWAVLAVMSALSALGAELSFSTETPSAVIFAKHEASIRVLVKNTGVQPKRVKLEYRLIHPSTGGTSISSERKSWKELILKPGEDVAEKVKLEIRAAKAPAMYLLKFFESGRIEELASLPLLICPETLVARLGD